MSLRSSKNTAADNEIIITPYFRALLSFPAISWRYPDWSLRDTLRPKEVLRSVPLGVDASAR
jgi:hypothetical protein